MVLIVFQEGQCTMPLELPSRAPTSQKDASGTFLAVTEDFPGNVVHSRLDGRNQGNLHW